MSDIFLFILTLVVVLSLIFSEPSQDVTKNSNKIRCDSTLVIARTAQDSIRLYHANPSCI